MGPRPDVVWCTVCKPHCSALGLGDGPHKGQEANRGREQAEEKRQRGPRGSQAVCLEGCTLILRQAMVLGFYCLEMLWSEESRQNSFWIFQE